MEPSSCELPQTGVPAIDTVVSVLGALYVLLSVVGNLIPKGSKIGETLRHLALDLGKFRAAPGKKAGE